MIHTKIAKKISYGDKRSLSNIKYIVIHYTGNEGDTAKGNATYFATSNTRQAGAHFFVDKNGVIYKSVNMNRTAWSVGGGGYSRTNGAGKYYGKCTNSNSVSIELCSCVKETNWEQMVATRKLVEYIQKKCPNAKTIIRHWDVNGKSCPGSMIGKDNIRWNELHDFLVNGHAKCVVIKNAAIRTNHSKTSTKIGTLKNGDKVTIEKTIGDWGQLKNKADNGKYRWISLKKIKNV